MRPTLQASSSILYMRLGKGKLSETLSCICRCEINGEYSLTFEYPITGYLYNDLLAGGTVSAVVPSYTGSRSPTPRDRVEFFDIYKYSKPINGVVTFYCNHISRRLGRTICPNGAYTTFDGIISGSVPLDLNGLHYHTTNYPDNLPGTLQVEAPKSALAVFIGSENSLVSTYGGAVLFYSTYYAYEDRPWEAQLLVSYLQTLGEDRGAYIRFGKNMLDVLHEKDTTGTFNAVVPFWSSGSGSAIKYVTDYVVQPTTPISPVIAVPLDLSSEFQSEPTEAQMVTAAQAYLDNNEPWKPTETITVDFTSDVVIDEGIPISLGDTVHVLWEGADIAAALRVVAYDYDVLAERYSKLELGTQQTQFVAVTGDSYAGTAAGGGGGGGSANLVVRTASATAVSINANGAADFIVPYSDFLSTGTALSMSGWSLTGTGVSQMTVYRAYMDDANSRFVVSARNRDTQARTIGVSVAALFKE